MKKNTLLLMMCIVMVQTLYAAPVTRAKALRTAEAFVSANLRMKMYGDNVLTLSDADDVKPYYIFNMPCGGGFVIVAGDDAVCPVLGYSYSGSIDADNMPDNLKTWLDGYAHDIEKIQKLNISPDRKHYAVKETRDSIPALLSSHWDQKRPFNSQCPSSPDGKSHRPAGCVATAMAQVMYYHKWPEGKTSAVKGYSYKDDKMYGGDGSEIVLEDLEPTVFDWGSMLDEYEHGEYSDEAASAVAELLKYVGYSVGMKYGVKSSAAFSQDIPGALVHTFGYKNTAHIIYRENYASQKEWESVIYNELSGNRPVIYSGITKMGSGHQFVCDGYENDYFHINWGWGGMSDGYFKLAVLDPYNQGIGGAGTGSSFSELQTAVIGIREPMENDVLFAGDVSIGQGMEETIDICLNNKRKDYISVQFDIHLPEGIETAGCPSGSASVSFNEQRSEYGDHLAGINDIGGGTYRVLAYSPQNSLITGSDGTLVNLVVKAADSMPDGCYRAEIKNIVICDKELVTRKLRDTQFMIDVKDMSGIDKTTADHAGSHKIYSVEGIDRSGSIKSLGKGIYIIDGRKVIVRI